MLLLDRPAAADLRPLRAHTSGEVVVAGEPVWGDVLAACDLAPGAEPAAVIFPADEFDVAAATAFARASGLDAVRPGAGAGAGVDGAVLVLEPGARAPWASAW